MVACPFDIRPFGTWAIVGGATPLGNSLVITGIPEDLDKMEVATPLVVGHGAYTPGARPPACTRPACATSEEAGAVVHCVRVSLTGTTVAWSWAHWSLVMGIGLDKYLHSVTFYVGMGPFSSML